MHLSVIQFDTIWENKDANFQVLEKITSDLKSETDIIILPEMFNTGFSVTADDLSENTGGKTFEWMKSLSTKKNCGVCGSYIIRSRGKYFNRWVFITPEKESWSYNKRHLFRMGNEHLKFSPGNKRISFMFRGVRICPTICYDLRFPVWSRNTDNYDLLINSANWPSSRRDVWITLLKARAIENQCYVAGANRSGQDGSGIKYSGDSMVINPRGEIISSSEKNNENVITADISIADLKRFRNEFPVLKDRDRFHISV